MLRSRVLRYCTSCGPKNLKYTNSHEWVRINDSIATVGITDFAQKELGDVVFVENSSVDSIKKGDPIATVESVKAASDIMSPVDGEFLELNKELTEEPSLLNSAPYDNGWIVKIKVADDGCVSSLLDHDEYSKLINS